MPGPQQITVETTIAAPTEKVWNYWTAPEHITQWCHASEDWHAPFASNDVKVDGKFKTTMASKDGVMSFDFEGIYTAVEPQRLLAYTMADGRTAEIIFSREGDGTKVTESFDPESTHDREMQKGGWQAILDNFRKHVEAN